MNKKREYYYRILGLKPGATPDEIKSAYRRLVKFYHPDRDNSPDSQSMYKEINIAYKALHNQATAGETDINSVINRNYSKKTSQTSGYNYERAQQTNADSYTSTSQDSGYNSERAQQSNANSGDYTEQQPASVGEELRRYYESRIPFKLQNLPSIFRHSLSELFAYYKTLLFKVFVSFMFILLTCRHYTFSEFHKSISYLIFLFHITSWILFVFFRYYFVPSIWPDNLLIAAATAYGAILPILIACFYSHDIGGLILLWLFTFASVFILIAPEVYFRKE